MTTTHQLDLLENAIDSLIEALHKLSMGDEGERKAYKFAVLHMAHFVELFFKYHISSKHPLLIYKDPFAQKLSQERTITLWDAINFINNESSGTVSQDLKKDLEWLKKLRNEIEHHKFTMNVPEVRITLGRIFRSVAEFVDKHTDIELEDKIPKNALAKFQVLSDEYQSKLHNAIKQAEEFEDSHPVSYDNPDSFPPRIDCEACGASTMILNPDSSTGYQCLMCGNEEGDDIPAACSNCGTIVSFGELEAWSDEHGDEYRCYVCSGRYAADKDIS